MVSDCAIEMRTWKRSVIAGVDKQVRLCQVESDSGQGAIVG